MAQSTSANAAEGRFRFRSPLPDETLAEYTAAKETLREREEEDDALLDRLSRVLVSLNNTPVHNDHTVHGRTANNEESECPTPGRYPLPPDVEKPGVGDTVPIRETPTVGSPGHGNDDTTDRPRNSVCTVDQMTGNETSETQPHLGHGKRRRPWLRRWKPTGDPT